MKDVDLFLFWEKFRSKSKEDVDPFLFWEKFGSTAKEDVDPFLFWKKIVNKQIFENKKDITTIIKELRTCFDKINQQLMLWILETTKLKK